MPRLNLVCVAVLALALVAAPSCGGGGHGFQVPLEPLTITTAAFPALLSGDAVDIEIGLDGGCGGPYVVTVISGGVNGGLPNGIGVENRLIADPAAEFANGPDGLAGNADDGQRFAAFLTGILLEDGLFNFVVQVTDSACSPFLTITQAYSINVGVGAVRIVSAQPDFIPEASFNDLNKHEASTNPSTTDPIDALPTTTYNQFSAIDLIVAGGVPPYSCAVIDDVNDPLDRNLPLGVVIPVSSCSLVGAPVEVLPGGVPFLLTIRVEDSTGASSIRKIQWKIDTPPIVVATTALPDGQAGLPYGEPIQTADGVPPFGFELINTAGEPDFEMHTYASPAVPVFPTTPAVTVNNDGTSNQKLAAVDYPAPAAPGPYPNVLPEGMILVDTGSSAGSLSGTPRRFGSFTINFHVYSTLVPNERGQHGFQSFPFTIAPSTPIGILPDFTVETTLLTVAPYSTLPEFERTVPYNPDIGTHSPSGLQLLAGGGVDFDGWTDAPHSSQRSPNPQEPTSLTSSFYRWEVAGWNPVSGDPVPPSIVMFAGPAGAAYSTGVLGSPDPLLLVRQSRRLVDLRVTDEQLPTANVDVDRLAYSVGPDKVIISESETSDTTTTTTGSGAFGKVDMEKVIRKFEVLAGIGTSSDLDATDLTATHVIPAAAVGGTVASNTALDDLLSGEGDPDLDLVRVSVNPTWWGNDAHSLNSNAARAHAHGDDNSAYPYRTRLGSQGGEQTNVASVDLPDASGIAHAPSSGLFTDGGRMHCFDSATKMGFFIIRQDASIYVPFAITKGTYNSFGDGMFIPKANATNSMLRSVQIAVSPDGRWGAVELHANSPSSSAYAASASTSRIVIFSLVGEKAFGGETYKIVNPIPAGGLTSGNYLYAASMALTNGHLYFLIGQETGTYASWRHHYVLRVSATGAATQAELVPGISGQNSTTPVQTPFQKVQSAFSNSSSGGFVGGSFVIVSFQRTQDEQFLYDGANYLENSKAPVPFRVSRNGAACAILAGPPTNSTSATDVMRHHLYVDYNGGTARQLTTASAFHYAPHGGARGPGLARGPNAYRHWGRYAGPATHLELSDDGMRAAFAAYSGSRTVFATSTSSNWTSNTMELFAFSANAGGGDPWSSVSVPPQSTNGDLTSNVFTTAHNWRFGSIGFTSDGDSIFFWAGAPNVNTTSTSNTYVASWHMEGSYYKYDFTASAVTKTIRSMLSTSNGGSVDGIKNYTTGSPMAITGTANYGGDLGYIMPFSGFFSRNRDFFYVSDLSPHTATGNMANTMVTLLGFNVSQFSGNTINGHPAGEGFEVSDWGNRRPFMGNYYYMPHYALSFGYYSPSHRQGATRQVMAKDTGYVFWATPYARTGTSQQTSASTSFSGPSIPSYWQAYFSGTEIWGMHADVGGAAKELTHDGLGDDNSNRMVHYMEVSDSGQLVSFVYDDAGSVTGHDDERIGHIFDIAFDPTTGAYTGAGGAGRTNSRIIEGSDGRASEAIAHDSSGVRLFYAYKAGSGGDEKSKQLVMALRNPVTGVITISRFFSGASLRYFDVLFAGR